MEINLYIKIECVTKVIAIIGVFLFVDLVVVVHRFGRGRSKPVKGKKGVERDFIHFDFLA